MKYKEALCVTPLCPVAPYGSSSMLCQGIHPPDMSSAHYSEIVQSIYTPLVHMYSSVCDTPA